MNAYQFRFGRKPRIKVFFRESGAPVYHFKDVISASPIACSGAEPELWGVFCRGGLSETSLAGVCRKFQIEFTLAAQKGEP